MNSSRSVDKIEGFVLKKKNLLQDDVLLTLFTREFGKIMAIAKGARRFSSRRAAHLQTGNLITARLSTYHEMRYIQSTDLISAFSAVRVQERMEILYLFLYILDRLLPPEQQEDGIYKTTRIFFIKLSKETASPQMILQDCLQSVLVDSGYVEERLALHELLDIVEQNIDAKLPRHVIM